MSYYSRPLLYHKDIGFPRHVKFAKVTGLVPSQHAQRERDSDRYGKFEIPTEFDPTTWTVIEIEMENSALTKIVARRPYDDTRDIIIVFMPATKVIKTVWINVRDDLHRTLDRAAYTKP